MEENLTTPSIIDVTNINEKVYDYIKKNITTFERMFQLIENEDM